MGLIDADVTDGQRPSLISVQFSLKISWYASTLCMVAQSEGATAVACSPIKGSSFGFLALASQAFHLSRVGELVLHVFEKDRALLANASRCMDQIRTKTVSDTSPRRRVRGVYRREID